MELTTRDPIPADAEAFLVQAGWGGAGIVPLDGDASFRRYFRVKGAAGSAMLMDAPPPHEDPAPYLRAAKWLDANGMRAPRILAEDAARGLVLDRLMMACSTSRSALSMGAVTVIFIVLASICV